jgi:hypothetical protein
VPISICLTTVASRNPVAAVVDADVHRPDAQGESNRRQAMAPFVIEERSGFYLGRELKIPER